jgi:hypothetical protein
MLKKFKINPKIICGPYTANNFPKSQKNSQILKSTQGYALSTNGGGKFLSWLVKN